MSTEHERFAAWDAAYVLGALSPSERDLFERHLGGCDRCITAVGELAPLPGLLSRVAPERAMPLLAREDDVRRRPGSPGEELRPDPAHRAEVIDIVEARSRRVRRWRWAGAIAAGAALVAAVVLVQVTTELVPEAPQATMLRAVADAPLSATVELDEVGWGTRVTMSCTYERTAYAPATGGEYSLVVISDAGEETALSTWRGNPDETALITAGTALRTDDIAAVEVRSAAGEVLLRSASTPWR